MGRRLVFGSPGHPPSAPTHRRRRPSNDIHIARSTSTILPTLPSAGFSMIEADQFIDPARAAGFDFYAGVPCSFLTPLINRVIGAAGAGLTYVGAASEG